MHKIFKHVQCNSLCYGWEAERCIHFLCKHETIQSFDELENAGTHFSDEFHLPVPIWNWPANPDEVFSLRWASVKRVGQSWYDKTGLGWQFLILSIQVPEYQVFCLKDETSSLALWIKRTASPLVVHHKNCGWTCHPVGEGVLAGLTRSSIHIKTI